MLNKILDFLKSWTVDTTIDGLIAFGNVILKILGILATKGEPLFIIVAIIGLFIVMLGNKKLGTKISSISILSYYILRMVTK